MPIRRLLIANRGEIAIRIARACADLSIEPVVVFSADDERSLHVRHGADARALPGRGPAAYLDGGAIVRAALDAGCDAVHPGYGFLSESAGFARACAAAGLVFVGPKPDVLELFGDKARARSFAVEGGVPVVPGSPVAAVKDARAFFVALPPGSAMMVKAVAGGGGRGMRVVRTREELDDAYERCQSEARTAFGDERVYVEQRIERARHIEVQAAGDGSAVTHFWERDCTLQRRHQKLVEVAPAPRLHAAVRDALINASLRLARAAMLDNLCTFEFLVTDAASSDGAYYFIEANPRIQVEHTVTEEITGVDLVQLQIGLAGGGTLAGMGIGDGAPAVRGASVQARLYGEQVRDGAVLPVTGVLRAFDAPSGPGVRVDTHGYAGYELNPAFDPLVAKVIAHAPNGGHAAAAGRVYRALCEFRIEGAPTNAGLLRDLLVDARFLEYDVETSFVDRFLAEERPDSAHASMFVASPVVEERTTLAGARLDSTDPLAVLDHGKTAGARADVATGHDIPDGFAAVRAPLQGTVVSVDVSAGQQVAKGQRLLVMEAMKMEHVVVAPASGNVGTLYVAPGDAVVEGAVLLLIEEASVDATAAPDDAAVDLERIRPDLHESFDRHRAGSDEARPDAVARRRKTGQRTARENIADLCDDGSFVEYGPLVLAAQRRRRSVEELIAQTPADGLVAGIGTVNAERFGDERARCIAMSYDYTVLAGTQGAQNHRKKDRMFELAEKWRLPVVLFAEGGGGRPGDTDGLGVAGLDCMAFHYFGRLSGLVPLVGIVSGRCFAGNAALLGCCDVVIATKNANIGMGGPAMIEGGGLGVFRPDEVGPTDVQAPNGVIDVLVDDEAAAVDVARRYLSYFQGTEQTWECADQRALRHAIPENRRRIYDVRAVIETLADAGSMLELRRAFGLGMITALLRVEGRPLGLIANNPAHLAGAIDSDGADKAARFMQLCDAFDLPILSLCDTPGIMVGPEVEKTALVRHASRMFVTGASVTVPICTIILRKAYGLGAQAMAGGSFKAPFFTVSWPTGEFGGMGLEGAVKLGYRNELAAIDDPEKRRATYDEMVERMYERGKAVNTASHFEIDDVIDPAESRAWITAALRSLPPAPARAEKKRPAIDTW